MYEGWKLKLPTLLANFDFLSILNKTQYHQNILNF